MDQTLKIDTRIWIQGQTATFMGEGRLELLERILETGSINEACKQMNMSYKKALRLIKSMNEQTAHPLVLSNSGGKGGGGTKVTKAGLEAMAMYKTLSARNKDFLEKEFIKYYDGH